MPAFDDDLDVPGTSRILDEDGQLIGTNNFTLVPTPSRDPNDPLNWSQPRKWLFLSCVVLFVALMNRLTAATLWPYVSALVLYTPFTSLLVRRRACHLPT